MKFSNIILFLMVCLIFTTGFQTSVVTSNVSSLKPILESKTENQTIYSKDTIDITWIILDDNPNDYGIVFDTQVIDSGPILTNLVTYTFNSIIKGVYNLTLIVTDHSGNQGSNSVIITVIYSSATSSTAGSSGTSSYDSSSEVPGGAGSIPFEFVILSFITLSIGAFRRRRNK